MSEPTVTPLSNGDPGSGDPKPATPVAAAPPAGDPPPDPGSPPPNPFSMDAMPDGWRNSWLEAAGYEEADHDKLLGRLERYDNPGAVLKAGFEAQDKIRAGEVSNGLPENPTDEQLAAWREANGVPPTVGEYSLDLGEGVVLGELDQSLIDPVLAAAHDHHVSNVAASDIIKAYLGAQEAQQAQLETDDNLAAQETQQALRQLWGHEYDINLRMANQLVDQMPKEISDDFRNARAPDGTALLNKPEVIQWLAQSFRSSNPLSSVTSVGDANAFKTTQDRITEIETMMGDDNSAYWKGGQAGALQAEYRQLTLARDEYERQRTA